MKKAGKNVQRRVAGGTGHRRRCTPQASALRGVGILLGGWLAVSTSPFALAGPVSPQLPLPLPAPGAPAAAYGTAVRGGRGHPNADDLAGLAERLREHGYLPQALQLSQRVRGYAPGNRQALQTEVSALSNLGSADLAYRLAEHHPGLFPATVLHRLRVDKTAADIRDAVAERRRLENHGHSARRNAPLRAVLSELEANLAALPPGSRAYVRTEGDRLYVLRELGRMPEVIRAYRALQGAHVPIPPYVKRAAADAYEQQKQPKHAVRLYREIIAAHPKTDVEVYIGLYYALVDGEDYAGAARVLAHIEHDTPVWISGGPHAPRRPNWERVDVDQLGAMDAAYRNHDAAAMRRARALYRAAPHNADLINTYATILRWRGWPQHARRMTELAAAYAPQARATRINEAGNARDLGHYDRWHKLLVPLARDFPDDSAVARNLAEWNDRHRASVSAELTVGHGSGNNAVTGNRDRQFDLRLNSPWSAGGWRVYGVEDYRWSAYPGGNASFNRLGAGTEWRWGRKHAWAVFSDDRFTGRHPGVQAGWSQWVNDRWQYQISADTYSADTPLRAERAGLRGRSLQGQLTWRGSESQSASLGVGVLDISDGNRRESLSAAFTQRVQSSAYHQTRLTFRVDDLHDTRPGGPYFNPPDLRSAGVTLSHDWVTWRRYQQSLTQSFQVSLGDEWQSRYGSAAGIDLLYRQSWQLSRTWSLHYGIGWGSHVYDGGREHRVFGVVGFSGVF